MIKKDLLTKIFHHLARLVNSARKFFSALSIVASFVVAALILFVIFAPRLRLSEVCGRFTWPLLVGKWEISSLAPGAEQRAQGPLNLFLYPGGEAVKAGHRGSWQIVACEGPTVLIDLPRRQQTDSCELRVDSASNSKQIEGSLSCAGSQLSVSRTETRGLISRGVTISLEKAIERRNEEEQAVKTTGWLRDLLFGPR